MRSALNSAARNDRITAVVLFILGIAMLVGGFSMDRLEVRRIHPASIPGLLPMILGATLAGCAAALYARAGRGKASAGATVVSDGMPQMPGETDADPSGTRVVATAVWSVIYALLLVGNLPFMLATALYIGGFVAVFGWKTAETPRRRLLLLARSAVLAAVGSWAIATLFAEAFLVRLP